MEDNFENQPIESLQEEFDVENLVESDGEISVENENTELLEEGSEFSEEENFSENEGEENLIENNEISIQSEEESEEEEEEEESFKKFDEELKKNYILRQHPEIISHNNHEMKLLSQTIRDKNGVIIDANHKTVPFLTKYEETKILGSRAKQINEGAEVFVDVPSNIIDGYTIAQMELKQKKIPFIIRRPIPNGNFEYWKISDLEQISY